MSRSTNQSGTDIILVARRETSGIVRGRYRSGEAPIYFIRWPDTI
jgi:hypothetical protein